MKKVLMIAYVFPPIIYVGTFRTLRFCRYLPENGWIPHVLTIKEGGDLDNDYGLLDRIPKEVTIYRTRTIDFWRLWNKRKKNIRSAENGESRYKINNNRVEKWKRNWLANIKSFLWELVTIPDHMVFWIPFAVLKGIQILKKERCDVIYTSSPPHSEQIIGLILSKIFKKPWVADFRDPWLDSFVYAPSRLRLIIDRILERLILNKADKVIMAHKYYSELICQRYPALKRKMNVLPNGFDSEIVEKSSIESFDKFTILYTGSFYGSITPEFFLKGFGKWIKKYRKGAENSIQALFYCADSKEGKRIVEEENLGTVVQFCGVIPNDQIIPKQKGAHLLLLIIGFDEKSKNLVTSKMFEYMASRRPILAIVPKGESADILRNYRKVYWVNREDDMLLIKCLDEAFEDYLINKGHFRPSLDSTALDNNSPYDARVQVKKLSEIFLSTLSK